MVGSLLLTPFIGVSFLPTLGQPGASITIDYPEGTSEQETLANVAAVEEIVRAHPDVEVTQTQIGGDTLAAAFTGAASNRATMTVTLNEETNVDETLTTLRDELAAVEGADINVSSLETAGAGTNGINVIVQGSDYEQVAEVTRQLTEQVAGVENVTNVENDVVESKPEIRISVDAQRAAVSGTAPAAIAGQVYSMLSGTQAGTVTIDGVPLPVTIRFGGEMTTETLGALPVSADGSTTIGDVGTVEQVDGPASIVRQDTVRTATITGAITSNDTGGPIADVQTIIDDFEAPEGVEIASGGIAQEQGDAFANMAIAILVAIAAVYIIMVASFNSLTTPFVILFSLPLAVIGVLLALFITGKTIGLSALIGVLMLVGIVVTNAIVLLEYVIELQRRGYDLRDAIIEGGKTRLRPILMTALATILALVPLALSNEGGALIAADLAVVVIGGLLTSTLLTLFVVPVVYELIGGWQEKRAARKAAREDVPQEAVVTPAD
jgi:HAE1 family hydrophobic/amphiphilic exporter-1